MTIFVFDESGKRQCEVDLSKDDADVFCAMIEDLKNEITNSPKSVKTESLKVELVDYLEDKGFLPSDVSKEDFISLMNPSPDFGAGSPFSLLPSGVSGDRGFAFFCNFVTFGEGGQFPIIVLPRLIPIMLIPIPRIFLHWNAVWGITSCGGLVSGKGFIASGEQTGTALGFWGIGFSVFLPPVRQYGFIGYALFATATAENLEPWPPNEPPVVSAVSPLDDAFNVSLSTSELKFRISDAEGEHMSYTVTTDPDVGSGSGNNKKDGVYSITISGLEELTEYTWSVEITDGINEVQKNFSFTTETVTPILYNPLPIDGAVNVQLSLSQLSFSIVDRQDDLMDYSVETIPDIGSDSGSNVPDGTYTVDISGLDFDSEYMWFVNVTDGEHWNKVVYIFNTKPSPGPWWNDEWMYRKEVIVDCAQVKGNHDYFPVLISLDSDDDLALKVQDDGDDIVFTDYNGEKLNHEIELFDGESGKLIAWINVPSFKPDTFLYMYYGNSNCSNQQDVEGTWTDNFLAVYHMNDESKGILDSTAYNRDSTDYGGNPTFQQAGISGYAIDFDGVGDEFHLPHNFNLGSSDITLEVWIKATSWPAKGEDSCIALTFTGEHYLTCGNYRNKYGDDDLRGLSYSVGSYGSWNNLVVKNHPPINKWIYVTGAYDNNIGAEAFYNAALIATDNSNGDLTPRSLTNRMGVNFDGLIDEVRISNTKRSNDWIETTYNSINNPSSFFNVGSEETSP